MTTEPGADTPIRVVPNLTTVDAAVQRDPDDGTVTLFLNPNQTFDSALAHARRLLSGVHQDVLRRLVREALPGLPGLAEGPAAADRRRNPVLTQPGVAREPLPPESEASRDWRWLCWSAGVAAVVSGVLVGGFALTNSSSEEPNRERQLAGADVEGPLLRALKTECEGLSENWTRACVHTALDGTTWGQTELVTSSPGMTVSTTIVDDSANVRVVFEDSDDLGDLLSQTARQFKLMGQRVVVGDRWLYSAQKDLHVDYLVQVLARDGSLPFHESRPDVTAVPG